MKLLRFSGLSVQIIKMSSKWGVPKSIFFEKLEEEVSKRGGHFSAHSCAVDRSLYRPLYRLCRCIGFCLKYLVSQLVITPIRSSHWSNVHRQEDCPRLLASKLWNYKHCFCYSNMPTTRTKDPLFRQPMRLWLAH